ncbi:28S ribosomal protein S34, mitochondrial-like [Acanthaster planci]|uniref:28S ribosomal protein S34, mitochondrial-like n=1 Tax=Acanthaster planci TaxID=133434 RepID=A0A8B7ZUD4_ACAPL|nr:28S ribosomal protein S34, mitochondrial-like [Acanthaster planci]
MERVHRHVWFTGKNLINILTELPNYGIGRLVTRRRWTMLFPENEPCYLKVTRVKIDCTRPELDQGQVWGELTYRGYKREDLEIQVGAWWKKEWELIRKADEEEFCKFTPKPEHFHVAPSHARMPPLLEAMVLKQRADKGIRVDPDDLPLLDLEIRKTYRHRAYQLASQELIGEY